MPAEQPVADLPAVEAGQSDGDLLDARSSSWRSLRPARSFNNARTGWEKKRFKSSSSTVGAKAGSGSGANPNTGLGGAFCARGAGAAPGGPVEAESATGQRGGCVGDGSSGNAAEVAGSNGCSGCSVMILLRTDCPSTVRAVRSRESRSSPIGTAGGRLAPVRGSMPA